VRNRRHFARQGLQGDGQIFAEQCALIGDLAESELGVVERVRAGGQSACLGDAWRQVVDDGCTVVGVDEDFLRVGCGAGANSVSSRSGSRKTGRSSWCRSRP
jgi:hypothetical protein